MASELLTRYQVTIKMAEDITLSVDLMEETQTYIAFLHDMIHNKDLSDHAFLTKALKRYRFLWLPLAAAREQEDIEPPADIHWIWYLHMVRPLAYFKDCLTFIGKVPCHKFHILAKTRESARERTRLLWQRRYSQHSFDVNTETKSEIDEVHIDDIANLLRSKSFDIEKTVEPEFNHILVDVASHWTFAYQVMLPHYKDEKFIEHAIHRYKRYLQMRRFSPGYNIPPNHAGIDVDLVHRAHMLRPLKYRQDLEKLFQGQVHSLLLHSNYNTPNVDGTTSFELKEIGKVPGGMFRGDPQMALRRFVTLTPMDIYRISHKGCTLGVKKLRIENVNYRNVLAIVGVAKWSTLEMTTSEFQSQGNPPYEWHARQSEDLVSMDWKTEGYEQFYVSVYRTSYSKSKHHKALIGCLFDKQLFDMIELADLQKKTLRPTFSKTASVKSLDVRFMLTAEIRNIRRLSVELSIKRSEFEQRHLPENIREIWGAFMLEKLPPGVSNVCTIALHRLYNHKEESTFTVRVVHSLPLRMSLLQVMYGDKMAAAAHLISSETLPLPEQVELKCPTINPLLGERAMLLKNANGDWAIIKACWKPSSDTKRFKPSDCGNIHFQIYMLQSGEEETLDLPVEWFVYLKQDCVTLMDIEVDLLSGRIRISPKNNDIAESVCLTFAMTTLLTLCLPSIEDLKKSTRFFCSCANEEDNLKNHELLLAVGYGLETPSNDWLTALYNSQSESLQVTSWSQSKMDDSNATMLLYHWHQPGGIGSRENSFEIERMSSSSYVNRSFDSGSETKF